MRTAREVHNLTPTTVTLADVPVLKATVPLDLVCDPRSYSLEQKTDQVCSYADIALAHPLIPAVTVSYNERFRTLTYVNSEGTQVRQERCELTAAVVVTARKGRVTEIQSKNFSNNHDYSRFLNKEQEVRTLAETAVRYLDAPVVQSGVYPVVCGPSQTGLFVHEAFGHLSEGDKVYKNDDLRAIMRMGRTFGPKILNIFDSGLDRGARGSLPYDDEGVATEKTYLIREGVLVGRLHSRQTAGIMGERPTGNGRALSYEYPPIVRMRNTSIQGGDSSFDDIIASIPLGVYAKKSKGGQTGGEMFTFTPSESRMIRQGRLAEPVRNVSLTGNLFETLKNIDMVGNDYQIFAGSCGKGEQFPLAVSFSGPHIKINNVIVGGSK